jgi:hypothetical protein
MDIDVLKDHIESARKWADEISGVSIPGEPHIFNDFITREKDILEKAVEAEDWSEAYDSMVELVNLCEEADRKLKHE